MIAALLTKKARVQAQNIVCSHVTFRRFVDDFRRWANRFVTIGGSFYDE